MGLILLAPRVMSGELVVSERAIETTVLAQSTQDWGGSPLAEYAQGQPEITVARVTIPVGMALPLHEHPFMTALFTLCTFGLMVRRDFINGQRAVAIGVCFVKARNMRRLDFATCDDTVAICIK